MLKVLIIGCGKIAGGFDSQRLEGDPPLTHAGAYKAHGGFSLAACVDPDGARRKSFMDRWGIARGYATTAEAIAEGQWFDVISVCSPTASHRDDVIEALRANPRLIFCEKPLAPHLADAQDIENRCRRADVNLAVNHNRRWAPDVVKLKADLAAGTWGALRSATGLYNKGVLNNGSHMIDLLQFLLGPLSLAWAGNPVWDYHAEDPTVSAVLSTRDGAYLMIGCGHAADYSIFELQLVMEQGIVIMENGGLEWRFRRPVPSPQFIGYKALGDCESRQGEYMRSTTFAIANIFDAVSSGMQIKSTGQSALAAQRLCDEIRRRALVEAAPATML